jgi:hypothetical protein
VVIDAPQGDESSTASYPTLLAEVSIIVLALKVERRLEPSRNVIRSDTVLS